MTQFTLAARPPFSLNAVIHSHGWWQLAPFLVENETLSYPARFSTGRAGVLAVEQDGPGVRVSTRLALTPAEEAEAADMVRWMLALDQDFSGFYAHAASIPALAHMENRAQGRVLRSPTLWEDVIKTILTTNTLWGGTKRMTAALVEQFGQPAEDDPARKAFPLPAAVAAADAGTLRTQTRLGYRAPYILELAQAAAAGKLDLEALKHADLPTPELRKKLMSLKGVGGYAAANLLMILGRYDFIPIDSWALKMVSTEWHGGAAVGPAEVEAAFAAFGEWKGLAYWFWQWRENA